MLSIWHDGRRLYVTGKVRRAGADPPGIGNDMIAHGQCRDIGGTGTTPYGLPSVIDVEKAEKQADGSAIVATVAAGCSPVATVESDDGEILWLAAKGDRRTLAFSTQSLEASPDNALLGYGNTGSPYPPDTAPIALRRFGGGRLLAVVNASPTGYPFTPGNLAILDATPSDPHWSMPELPDRSACRATAGRSFCRSAAAGLPFPTG